MPDFAVMEAEKVNKWEEGMDDFACAIGRIYWYDLSNVAIAQQCFELPGQNGCVRAYFNLGLLYEKEKKDIDKAVEWYTKSAELGSSNAMVNLGWLYQFERKDIDRAEAWYTKSAELGNSSGMFNLGWLYVHERKDIDRAEAWYIKSADLGNSFAMKNLCRLYEEEKKDLDKAEEWYIKSVELGNSDAMNGLAWDYFMSKKNKQKCIDWSSQAFEKEPDTYYAHTHACILLWDNQIEKTKIVAQSFLWDSALQEGVPEDFTLFLTLLLAKNQEQYLYELFTSPEAEAQSFKDRFKPIWYAILKKLDHPDFLRMGDELSLTVEEVLARAEQLAIDYA